MDRKQVVALGMKTRKELLQRKGLEEIKQMAKGLGIVLPDEKLFVRPEQKPDVRIRQETKYKLGVINEIVHREYRNT
jgi:hypothetical protein